MQTPDTAPLTQPAQLSTAIVAGFMAATNNEVKCLALNAMATDIPRNARELYGDIMVGEDGLDSKDYSRTHFSGLLHRLPGAAVQISSIGTEDIFQRTEAGELVAAFGGHLLGLSKASSRSIFGLIGEHSPSRTLGSGHTTMDSLEARLAVLTVMHQLSPGRWRSGGPLYKAFKAMGVHERAALTHITSLEKYKIAEQKTRPRAKGGQYFEKRLTPDNGYMGGTEMVSRFLGIVRRLVVLDDGFVEEGLEHGGKVLADGRMVRAMVRRSAHAQAQRGRH